jgi:UDP-N-acetylglucosamine 2-epimerase
LCFDTEAEQNLRHESIPHHRVMPAAHPSKDYLDELFDVGETVEVSPSVLVTFHRRERRSERQSLLIDLIARTAQHAPRVRFELFSHPGVDWSEHRRLLNRLGVELAEPLPPSRFLRSLASATCVITDSAGVVEEASRLAVPCVSFRSAVENRAQGVGEIVATEDPEVAFEAVAVWLERSPAHRRWNPSSEPRPRIADQIAVIVGDLH